MKSALLLVTLNTGTMVVSWLDAKGTLSVGSKMAAAMIDTWAFSPGVRRKPAPLKLNLTKYRARVAMRMTMPALSSQP